LSIFAVGEVKAALFPATSVTVTLPLTDAPSVVNDNGLGTDVEATPESASAAVNGTEMLVLFQPAAFGAGAAAPKVSVGAVLSILNAGEVNVAMFPAISVTVTVAVTVEPSVARDSGLGTEV